MSFSRVAQGLDDRRCRVGPYTASVAVCMWEKLGRKDVAQILESLEGKR